MLSKAKSLRIFMFALIVVFILAMLPVLSLSGESARVQAADGQLGWYFQDSGTKNQIWSIDAFDGNKAWAATLSGILKTTDGGDNWNNCYSTNSTLDVSVINANKVWAIPGGNDKILKTIDGGTIWTEIDTGTGFSLSVVSAVDQNTIWAAGDGGAVIMTTDGGLNWNDRSVLGFGSCVNDIDAIDTTTAWATGGSSIVRTKDGGVNWSKYTADGQVLGIDALDKDTAWAVGFGVLKTDDGGKNWRKQGEGVSFNEITAVCTVNKNTAWVVSCIGEIYKTTDGGASWFPQKSGTTATLRGVTAIDPNTAWAVGDGGIILHTIDGGGYIEPPQISTINPASARVGAIVSLTGNRFGDTRGYSNVKFDSVKATEYTYWSDTQINVVVPEGVSGEVKVTVTTAGGTSNSKLFTVFVPDYYSYYFAEGCTRDTFSEWLCIQNPGDQSLEVNASYMLFGGAPVDRSYFIPASSRVSIHVNDPLVGVGPGQDVSVKLWGEGEFYAERPMYFSYKGGVEGFSWDGGHVTTGAPAPAYDWYFAEGCTREGFEEWLCIQNPNDKEVNIGIDYITAGAYVQHKDYMASANSRISVFVNGDVGPGQDVSTHVHCDDPIVVERPMYYNYQGKWEGGHVVMGTDSPKTSWYFAEGTTREGFDTWLAVQNANNADAHLTVTFMKGLGAEQIEDYTVGANSRWTLSVNQAMGADVDCGFHLESDQPVVAERPMYFSYGPGWTGGHDVLGTSQPKMAWYFAEGCTREGFDEYICLINPGDQLTHYKIVVIDASGNVTYPNHDGAHPRQRRTYPVRDWLNDSDVSIFIYSFEYAGYPALPLIIERAMYFNYNGVWDGGHATVGYAP